MWHETVGCSGPEQPQASPHLRPLFSHPVTLSPWSTTWGPLPDRLWPGQTSVSSLTRGTAWATSEMPPANLPHVSWLPVESCQPVSHPSGRGTPRDAYSLTQSLGQRAWVLHPHWFGPALTRGPVMEHWRVSHCYVGFLLTQAVHFILTLPDVDSFILI